MTNSVDKLQLQTYLYDLGKILKDDAREAARDYHAASPADRGGYLEGRQLAYYEVITTLQQQAIAFGSPFEILNLADIDPDKELL